MRAALVFLVALGAWASPVAAQAPSPPPGPASAETPAKSTPGYILYRVQRRMSLVFRREMSPAEEEAAIADARREVHMFHEQDLAEWERVEASCRGDGALAFRCDHRRPRPEELVEEDGRALLDPDSSMISVDRRNSAAETPGTWVYLVEARAGSYVLYGQREMSGDRPEGVCLCMGSLRFEVSAGEVVDLGTITFPGLEAANARPSERQAMTDAMENSIVLVPPQPGAAPPGVVGDRPLHPAQLRAADKQDNFYGLYIDRHPAMPGVLRYERDRVLDDRTGQEPAPLP